MENRQLAAIMFTDILGYTSLMTEDEKRTINLVDKSISVVKPLVNKYQGKVIKEIGDGTLSSFPSAVNAVKCAVEIQTKVQNTTAFKLRIGIHLGDVVFRDKDVFGRGVNVASRLESIALPGSIFISGQVFDQLQSFSGLDPVYVGKKKLKNVKSPVDIYKISTSTDPDRITSEEETLLEDDQEVRKRSLVILPFKDLSPEKDMQKISLNLCEGIINDLSGLSDLKVISSTSSTVLIESSKTIRQLYDEFNIDFVLEGTLKKAEDSIRISTQLIEGINDKLLWSSKFKGSMNDLSNFQKEISHSIIRQLKLTSNLEKVTKKRKISIDKPSILEYEYKYHQCIFSFKKEHLDHAIRVLQEGIEMYGDNIIFNTALGIVYFFYLYTGNSSDTVLINKVEEYSKKVDKLNPESSQSYLLKGILAYHKGELQETGYLFNQSRKLNPNDPVLLYFYTILCRNTGEFKMARTLSSILAENYPNSALSQLLPAIINFFAGNYQEAYEIGNMVLQKFEGHPLVLFYSGIFSQSVNAKKEALTHFEINFQNNEYNMYAAIGLVFKYALTGNREMVLLGMDKYVLLKEIYNEELCLWIADIFCMVGENDEAIKWIINAVNKGFIDYSYIKSKDPYLEPLRNDESIVRVLKNIRQSSESI